MLTSTTTISHVITEWKTTSEQGSENNFEKVLAISYSRSIIRSVREISPQNLRHLGGQNNGTDKEIPFFTQEACT